LEEALAEGSGSESTAAKEDLPRPTMMDAMDGRLGLGRQQLLWVARREGGRERDGTWEIGSLGLGRRRGRLLQVANLQRGIFSFRVRVRRKRGLYSKNITIKIKNTYWSYWLYRLTDNKILIDQ
jgi:hypothetical protein